MRSTALSLRAIVALRNVTPVRFDCMESVLKIEPNDREDADFSNPASTTITSTVFQRGCYRAF